MSTTKPLGTQAIEKLEIEDVFLIEAESKVSRDFNQSDRTYTALLAVQRHRVEEQVFAQQRRPLNEPDNTFTILRYFFVGEISIAKPPFATAVEEIPAEHLLAFMKFVIAVDYRLNGEPPSAEMLGAFSRNVVFHAWPYWRESVHSECARMRIPAVTVPMLKAGQVSAHQAATVAPTRAAK